MEITSDFESHTATFLELEYQASEPYTRFVFSSPEQALAVRRFLYAKGLCEFSPPYGRLVMDDGRAIGMIAHSTFGETNRSRLRAAFALSKSQFFEQDVSLQARLRLAGGALLKLRPNDFYLSRIAVHEDARGSGVGGFLMSHFELEARRRKCLRLVLEVCSVNEGAVRLYQRQQFEEVDVCRVVAPDDGRSLEYIHMAKSLA